MLLDPIHASPFFLKQEKEEMVKVRNESHKRNEREIHLRQDYLHVGSDTEISN